MARKGTPRWEIWNGDTFETVIIGGTREQIEKIRDEEFPTAQVKLTLSKGAVCARYSPNKPYGNL